MGAGLCEHGEKLKQDGNGHHASDAARIEGWRDLYEIGTDEIEPPEVPDQALGFKCREAARLRRPRPRHVDWIGRVDIEREMAEPLPVTVRASSAAQRQPLS